jgi:hypothetical protein
MAKRKPRPQSAPKRRPKPRTLAAPAVALTEHQQQTTRIAPGGLALTAEDVERLIAKAQYQQHPYGKVWQRFDLDTFNELAGNIRLRGLDQDILLYQDKILEGWHRYLGCLATERTVTFIKFEGTDLEAAERVHASGVRRQSTPEQRYASFVLLCEECPEFKQKYELLREKGAEQQETGKPLSTDGQRVDVIGSKAKAAGVSRSTAAKVEKVKKHKPEAVAEIAAARTSANKVLKGIKKTKQSATCDGTKADTPDSGNSGKGERPKITDILEIVQRGLRNADEAERIAVKRNSVFFVVAGHRVQVTCKIL